MFRDRSKVKGQLSVRVFTATGEQKKRTTWNSKVFLGMFNCAVRRQFQEAKDMFKYEMMLNHNIVTDQGDALIADLMAQTPAKQKLDNTNGYIDIGDGWTGTTPKANEVINTPLTTIPTVPKGMEATYPKLKGTFGNADDNVVQYRSTFTAGLINDTGIDEAGLINNVTRGSADMLAYAQITPTVDVTVSDTLQVDWEIELLGA